MKIYFLVVGMAFTQILNAQYTIKIDSLKSIVSIQNDSDHVALLYDIAWEYRNSAPDSTIAYARKALDLARELNLKNSQAKALNFIGIAYHYKGDYLNSFEYLSQALEHSKSVKDSVQYAHALNTLGRLFLVQGDLIKSYNYFVESRQVFETIDDQQGLSYSYKSLAELYHNQGKIGKSLEMLELALDIRIKIGDERGAIPIYNDLARLYEGNYNFEKAFEYYSYSKEIAERIGDEISLAEISIGIADIYYNQSKFQEAFETAIQAEEYIGEKDNDDLRTRVYLQLGKSLLALNKARESLKYLNKVIELGEEAGNKNIVMQAYYHLHLKAEKEKNIADAHQYFHEYFELRKYLEDTEKARQIERLEARLEIENKEKENELLLARQARDQALIREQQIEKTALLLLALLATGYMINLWITARRRRLANKRLEEKNQHIALQKAEIAKQNEQIQLQNANLQKRNAQLSQLNEEKDNLMNIMAHDLKGPFNRIVGLVELTKMSLGSEREVQKYLEMMRNVSVLGISLIRDLLDVHSFEAERWVIKYAQIEIREFLEKKVSDCSAELEMKNISVTMDAEPIAAPFYSDETYLSRIIDNLLSNAIKFSDADSVIRIRSYQEEDNIFISIQDQGPGFTQEDQSNLYKKFKRLSARPTGGESSNGLGLAIVKLLIDQLNGEIELISKKGKGSEFIIKFPLKEYSSVSSLK